MKAVVKVVGVIALALVIGLGLNLTAMAKIAVVDTAKVMKEYKKTQQAQERLEKEVEDKKVELKKAEESLTKKRSEIQKQEGIVSKKKMEQLQKDYMNEEEGYRDKLREAQSMMMSKQKTVLESILNDVKEVAAQIAKAEKLELILDKDSIIYCDGDDITYKVLDKLNGKK